MLKVLKAAKSESPSAILEKLEPAFRGTLQQYATSFSRDGMLKRFQSSEDLYNIALLKLAHCVQQFVYEPQYDDEHNERRFIALLRTSVRRALIDESWAANVDKRKPEGGIQSLTSQSDDGEFSYEPPAANDCPDQLAVVAEIIELVKSDLNPDECDILDYLAEGYPAEKVAGKLGVNISRVRYVLYDKIQPRMAQYVGG